MTPELRAALLAVAEARAAINAAEEPTPEQRQALTDADAALAELLRADPDPDPLPVNDPADPATPEERERRELRGRARVGRILSLRSAGHSIDGAEAEVAEAHDCPVGRIPVEMLFDDYGVREDRAASAAGNVQSTNTHPIAPSIFLTALARRMGISTPTVPAGIQAYPYISADGSAGPALPGAADANNAKAAGVSVSTIWPARITGTIAWRMEDAALLGDLESALRANIRAVMEDAMDKELVAGTGDGSVGRGNNVSTAGLKGLLTSYPAVAPSDADKAKASTVDNIVAGTVGLLDGTYAESFAAIRLLTSTGAAKYLKGLLRGQATDTDMLQYLESTFASVGYSARMPDTAASSGVAGYAPVLAHRTSRGIGGIAPVWQGIETIVDQVSGAAKGETSVTLRMLMGGVLVLHSAAYETFTLKTAVGA